MFAKLVVVLAIATVALGASSAPPIEYRDTDFNGVKNLRIVQMDLIWSVTGIGTAVISEAAAGNSLQNSPDINDNKLPAKVYHAFVLIFAQDDQGQAFGFRIERNSVVKLTALSDEDYIDSKRSPKTKPDTHLMFSGAPADGFTVGDLLTGLNNFWGEDSSKSLNYHPFRQNCQHFTNDLFASIQPDTFKSFGGDYTRCIQDISSIQTSRFSFLAQLARIPNILPESVRRAMSFTAKRLKPETKSQMEKFQYDGEEKTKLEGKEVGAILYSLAKAYKARDYSKSKVLPSLKPHKWKKSESAPSSAPSAPAPSTPKTVNAKFIAARLAHIVSEVAELEEMIA